MDELTKGPRLIGDILRDLLEVLKKPRERHPIVRSGEREPIPWLVRLSIYERDNHRCKVCHHESPELELDHILPWSAGGGDYSANLRTLCSPCNQQRSNYDDGAQDRLPRPTTWWCWHCWRDPAIAVDDEDLGDWNEPRSRFRSTWKDGTNLAAAPYVTDPAEHVYCATCETYSHSNVLFSAAMQDQLVALCAARLTTTTDHEESA